MVDMHEERPAAAARAPGEGAPKWAALGILLIVLGGVGWLASTALLVERLRALQNPGVSLACDFSPFVSCGALFDRWQASLLGFPNPIIGVAGFIAPMVIGAGILAGARFSPWFWRATCGGLLAAWVFVTWLFSQSVFEIGVLCPYCLVVWAATIPLWWSTIVITVANGQWGVRAAHGVGSTLTRYLPVIIVANFAVIAIAIVLRFPYLFGA